MTFEDSLPTRPVARKYALIALGAIVVIAAVVVGLSLGSTSPLPVLNASYKCVPGSLIPQLKPGQSGTLTESYGGFTATFHATAPTQTPANSLVAGTPFKGTLTMTEGGQSWTLRPPARTRVDQINAMCVINYERGPYPGVMIEGFSGGAHCCELPVIYLYSAKSNRYVKVVDLSDSRQSYVFDANEGFIPEVVGEQVLLTTGDDRFSYAFGCYACSATPLLLYAVDPAGIADVTSGHKGVIAAYAQSLWQRAMAAVKAENAVATNIPAPFGLLAPWVADECEIGRGSSAINKLELLQREGKLSDALYHQATLNHGSFILDLRSLLLSDGYCTGQI